MHILAFIIMFIVASIAYACKGDYSGLEVILKVIACIAAVFIFGFMLLNPALLVVVIVVVVITIIAINNEK